MTTIIQIYLTGWLTTTVCITVWQWSVLLDGSHDLGGQYSEFKRKHPRGYPLIYLMLILVNLWDTLPWPLVLWRLFR